jgi:hypothetical protein
MRSKAIGLLLSVLFLAVTFTVPVLAKPTPLIVPFNQAQFQWRALALYGDWSYVYQNYATSGEYLLTGKVLHASWSYSPIVSDERGASTVYVYDKKSDRYIEHEGKVSYMYPPLYGDYRAVNYFRGYLEFDGTPAEDNFEHGVAYQWVYIHTSEDDTGVTAILPYAQWDEKMNAWLVGFSIYLWDTGIQTYDDLSPFEDPAFPDPFIEPIPANNYNPLDR